MADPRLAAILARIDHAIDRLEERPVADPDLPARHAALRRAMTAAIAQLDGLIEVEGR